MIEAVYTERNRLIALLSAIFESHLYHGESADILTDEWPIVCIHTPCGQMSWHIPKRELEYFSHLNWSNNDWDGHTTEEKYQRLEKLKEVLWNAHT